MAELSLTLWFNCVKPVTLTVPLSIMYEMPSRNKPSVIPCSEIMDTSAFYLVQTYNPINPYTRPLLKAHFVIFMHVFCLYVYLHMLCACGGSKRELDLLKPEWLLATTSVLELNLDPLEEQSLFLTNNELLLQSLTRGHFYIATIFSIKHFYF